MKAKQTVLMLGLLAAMTALAVGQQTTNVTPTAKTTVNISKTQLQPVYPVVQYKLEDSKKKAPKNQGRITHYEGLSSQAWTTIATQNSDDSVFHDAKDHEPKLCLFSLGHEPW